MKDEVIVAAKYREASRRGRKTTGRPLQKIFSGLEKKGQEIAMEGEGDEYKGNY